MILENRLSYKMLQWATQRYNAMNGAARGVIPPYLQPSYSPVTASASTVTNSFWQNTTQAVGLICGARLPDSSALGLTTTKVFLSVASKRNLSNNDIPVQHVFASANSGFDPEFQWFAPVPVFAGEQMQFKFTTTSAFAEVGKGLTLEVLWVPRSIAKELFISSQFRQPYWHIAQESGNQSANAPYTIQQTLDFTGKLVAWAANSANSSTILSVDARIGNMPIFNTSINNPDNPPKLFRDFGALLLREIAYNDKLNTLFTLNGTGNPSITYATVRPWDIQAFNTRGANV